MGDYLQTYFGSDYFFSDYHSDKESMEKSEKFAQQALAKIQERVILLSAQKSAIEMTLTRIKARRGDKQE